MISRAPGLVRLGAVSFLNSRPLTAVLEDRLDDGPFTLSYDVPSACSSALRNGHIDVGLVPTIEYAVSPIPYRIVPEVAVGCRGSVLTVRLFFRGELHRVRNVAVDTSSQTSVTLLRILLAEKYGLRPTFELRPPDLDDMLHYADAALLIGDPVLPLFDGVTEQVADAIDNGEAARSNLVRHSLDLGAEWAELTGLPFVFAFWVGRADAMNPVQVQCLIDARRQGEKIISQIANQFQHERTGSVELYERYLSDNVAFDLGDEECAGIAEFYRLAQLHGEIESAPDLHFYQATR